MAQTNSFSNKKTDKNLCFVARYFYETSCILIIQVFPGVPQSSP